MYICRKYDTTRIATINTQLHYFISHFALATALYFKHFKVKSLVTNTCMHEYTQLYIISFVKCSYFPVSHVNQLIYITIIYLVLGSSLCCKLIPKEMNRKLEKLVLTKTICVDFLHDNLNVVNEIHIHLNYAYRKQKLCLVE